MPSPAPRSFRDLTNPSYRALKLPVIDVLLVQYPTGERIYVPAREVTAGLVRGGYVVRENRRRIG